MALALLAALVAGAQTGKKSTVKIDPARDTVVAKARLSDLQIAETQSASLRKSNDRLRDENKNLEGRLRALRVDEFLNLRDTTIFGSRFESVDMQKLPPRSRDFYTLVRSIHDLDNVLNAKVDAAPPAELLGMMRRNAEAAQDLLDAIYATDRRVLSWLSPQQEDHLRRLTDKYNELVAALGRN